MQKPGSKEHCIKHGLNHGQKYKSCIPAYRGFTISDVPKPVSKENHHWHVIDKSKPGKTCIECGEVLESAPKLTPIDIEFNKDGLWLDDKLIDYYRAFKALADKVNEIIGLINEERK